jgi:hypothetical protein
MISCSGSKPWFMPLVPGSHFSTRTNRKDRKVAEANSGTEVVMIDRIEIDRSVAEPSRMPASTPSTTETGTITAKTKAARIAVLPRRGHSTAATDVLNRRESPKLPLAIRPSQAK